MACDRTKLMVGPVFVSIDGTDLGFTEADGVTLSIDQTDVEFDGGQKGTIQSVAKSLTGAMVTFNLAQLSQANLVLLNDFASPVSGVMQATFTAGVKTEHELTLTGQLADGSPRTITGNVTINVSGDMPMGKNTYSSIPVECKLIGDTNDLLFTVTDTAASATAPTISSYDTVEPSDNTETGLADSDTGVAVDEWFQVVFSQDLRASTVNGANFKLALQGANTFVALDAVTFGVTASVTDQSKVVMKPSASLSTSSTYELIVTEGVKNLQGVALAAAARIQFTTTS